MRIANVTDRLNNRNRVVQMLQQEFPHQVKISLQQDLNYFIKQQQQQQQKQHQQQQYKTGYCVYELSCCCCCCCRRRCCCMKISINSLKCGLKNNEKILHNYNCQARRA
uniref:Uncharacterized protein n=1 Tax=Glossina pallidipes TaxID=7398 RepID=A0A1A9ZRZ8_GLOPL